MNKLVRTSATPAVIIIRVMVGAVFLSEGMQKFLIPEEVGAGRFERIGFANPEFTAGLVGSFEIICGVMVLAGLLTRLAVVPLIIIMLTAIATTKVPILLNEGFWAAAHASRNDWSMLLGSLFLLIVGGGRWSVDGQLSRSEVRREDS